MPARKNINDFIKEAREIHGDKYNYSKVKYINNTTPVIISCPEHGEFLQTPKSHLLGSNCPECVHENRFYTKEEFIKQAKNIHGNKFNYDKVNYVDINTPVTIVCPEHGEFLQTPSVHLRRVNPCSMCISRGKELILNNSSRVDLNNSSRVDKDNIIDIEEEKILTTEEFINKAKEIHGNKYNYDKVNYVNNKTLISIICSKHGEFQQKPNKFLNGCGCNKCKTKVHDAVSFISKAKEIHGDKYDYSKVNYVNNTTPVSIICPIHGEFLQKPCNHLNNCGCVYCNRNYLTKDDFIKRAKEVHGDKYDYSKVSEPIKTKQPVTIICPVHGEFQQTPGGHIIKRSGCSQCVVDSRRLSQDDFIKRAKEVHGDRYDYSLSVYESYHSNITIICPTHGKFQQAASIHISGAGCPKCNISSRLEERVQNFLITNNISFDIQVTWPWLQFSSKQYVDFYLPDYNIAIECQGKQHFEPVEFFGGEEGFKYCTERDKNKLKLCNEHGIKVVYFSNLSTSTKCYQYPYKVYEDVSQLFKEELNIEIN